MIPLPSIERVKDYFLWRQEDAYRNALNAHCYWALRKNGASVQEATEVLEGKSVGYKNELLFQHGINFNDVPSWQKRGIGVVWGEVSKQGFNPLTQENVITSRRELCEEYELPLKESYAAYIEEILGRQKN